MIAQRTLRASEMALSIPPGFMGIEPEVTTGGDMGPVHEALRASSSWAPIWRIIQRQRVISLKRPLLVRVYSEGDFVFAENESLSVCGVGSSSEEAMADFALHLVHFHEYYRKLSAREVIGEGARLKEAFADLFMGG